MAKKKGKDKKKDGGDGSNALTKEDEMKQLKSLLFSMESQMDHRTAKKDEAEMDQKEMRRKMKDAQEKLEQNIEVRGVLARTKTENENFEHPGGAPHGVKRWIEETERTKRSQNPYTEHLPSSKGARYRVCAERSDELDSSRYRAYEERSYELDGHSIPSL